MLAFWRLRDISFKRFPAAHLRQFPGVPSYLRVFAGFNELDESCGVDVEDELVLEHDENPLDHKENKSLLIA